MSGSVTRRGESTSKPSSLPGDTSVQRPPTGWLAESVAGRALPVVPLAHHSGARIVLQGKWRALAIYTYPGNLCSPEDGYRSPSQDIAQHQAFAGRCADLNTLRCRAVGISSQSVELQRDVNVEHLLLCDPRLEFARDLGLPSFTADGSRWYRRCILVVAGGRVVHAVHPVSSPGQSALRVIEWLRANQDEFDGG